MANIQENKKHNYTANTEEYKLHSQPVNKPRKLPEQASQMKL